MHLTLLPTKGKRVFHVSILSVDSLGDVYTSDCLSYRQTSTCFLRHTVYITVVVFVCP